MKILSKSAPWLGVLAICLAAGLGFFGGFALKTWLPGAADPHKAPARVTLAPGPWGELEYVPLTIAAPAELLPVRAMEQSKSRWFMGKIEVSELTKIFDGMELPPRQREQLLAPEAFHEEPSGIFLEPPPGFLLSLSENSRINLYRYLALFRENDARLTYLATDSFETRFQELGVSAETLSLFKKYTCPSGRYLVFAGLPEIIAGIPDYQEKVRFVRALTRQKSLLLRLHVTPKSDYASLVAYWGKACWNTDVKAMLESLGRVPGGTWVDVVELLPPLPTKLLYTFPQPGNPLNGAPIRRDCHWTAFNFFRDPPDNRFSDPAYVFERLKLDYLPVTSDPRYGDLILFAKPDGSVIHSAVYLADNVVFSKNGDTSIHPWMLTTVPDLLEQYSFLVGPNEQLGLSYYRNKYY